MRGSGRPHLQDFSRNNSIRRMINCAGPLSRGATERRDLLSVTVQTRYFINHYQRSGPIIHNYNRVRNITKQRGNVTPIPEPQSVLCFIKIIKGTAQFIFINYNNKIFVVAQLIMF